MFFFYRNYGSFMYNLTTHGIISYGLYFIIAREETVNPDCPACRTVIA